MATHAQTKLRVGICARTVSMGVGSPFAIAMKMGWFKQQGLDVGYGLAVPADSPIQKAADLKGKNIGMTSLASAGVVVARAQVAAAGLDPDRDVNIVVAGEGAQPAALIRNRQIDALSQFCEDIDALVAAAHVEKEWMPDLSASMLRLSDTGRA